MAPLVSVCLPTYNRPAALAQVVLDILKQTCRDIEIVITDDGDQQATRAALGPLLSHVRYEPNPVRLGIYGNWNRSISLARGEYVANYHDHDIYAPSILERSVRILRDNPNVGVVHVATEIVRPTGERVPAFHSRLPEVMSGRDFARLQSRTWASYVAHGSLMVRRSLYTSLGLFDESMGITADMEMLSRFCMECDIGYVRELLYGYRERTASDPLYDFVWQHREDYFRVQRLNIERAYKGEPSRRFIAKRYLDHQIDMDIIRQLLYLKVHRRDRLVAEGFEVLTRHGSSKVALALGKIVTSDTIMVARARMSLFAVADRLKRRSIAGR